MKKIIILSILLLVPMFVIASEQEIVQGVEEPQWKDADSAQLLKTVVSKVYDEGWKIENLDCVIKLEKPKFIPHRTQVIKSIADILQIDENQVFVKAKTGEKLAEIGRSEAVEVWCVCLLSR